MNTFNFNEYYQDVVKNRKQSMIMIVGQRRCGKTTLIQNFIQNKYFYEQYDNCSNKTFENLQQTSQNIIDPQTNQVVSTKSFHNILQSWILIYDLTNIIYDYWIGSNVTVGMVIEDFETCKRDFMSSLLKMLHFLHNRSFLLLIAEQYYPFSLYRKLLQFNPLLIIHYNSYERHKTKIYKDIKKHISDYIVHLPVDPNEFTYLVIDKLSPKPQIIIPDSFEPETFEFNAFLTLL